MSWFLGTHNAPHIDLDSGSGSVHVSLGDHGFPGGLFMGVYAAREPADLARIQDAAAGDRETAEELIRVFLEESGARVGALQRAHRDRDWRQRSEEAHSLKGASANIGAAELEQLAGQLERSSGNGELADQLVARLVEEEARVRSFLEAQRSVS